MDELKKWAEKNKAELDSYYRTNHDSLWEEIDKSMQKGQGAWYSGSWMKWAAAIIILVVAGGIFMGSISGEAELRTMSELSPELADTEIYYSTQLGEKLQIIQSSGVELDQQVYDDLEQLDLAYRELMNDLQDNADNEEVVRAMIENYRLRLQMLEQILNEIQGVEKNENDEITI